MTACIESQGNGELHGFLKVLAVIAVGIGVFLITLDQFIVTVSVSTIAGELGVSDNNGSWSITAYTTASAFAIPLTGWLTNRIGRVRLFSLSAFLFSIASFLCGTADSLGELILFRILQGIVGGPLIPLSQTLMLTLLPKNRSVALGIFGMLVMLGPVVGPILGGWITFDYGWRPIFYINVPIGIAVAVISATLLSRFENQKIKERVDYVGLFLLLAWVAAYQVMMNKGYDWGWFLSERIRLLGIIAAICFTFFIIWEWYQDKPVVDLSYLKSRNFVMALVIMTPIMAVLFCNLVVGPLWTQSVLGYNQVWSGLTLAPLGVSALIIFPLVGRYMPLLDLRIWVFLALVDFAICFFWMSASPIVIDFRTQAYQRILMGIGFAMIYPPLTAISISQVSNEQMPSASGLFSFTRMMGLGFGVAYGVNFYLTREVFFQQRYGSYVIPSNEAFTPYLQTLKEVGFEGQQQMAGLYEMVQHQAYTESYLELCYISGLIACLLIFLLPLIKKSSIEGAVAVEG